MSEGKKHPFHVMRTVEPAWLASDGSWVADREGARRFETFAEASAAREAAIRSPAHHPSCGAASGGAFCGCGAAKAEDFLAFVWSMPGHLRTACEG